MFLDKMEGYGNDKPADVGAYPFSQPVPKDEHDELRQQLQYMGGCEYRLVYLNRPNVIALNTTVFLITNPLCALYFLNELVRYFVASKKKFSALAKKFFSRKKKKVKQPYPFLCREYY